MAISLSNYLRDFIIDSIKPELNQVDIYSGTAPANASAQTSGSLLVSIMSPIWEAAADGTAPLASTYPGTAIATGTAGYARARSTYELKRIQGNVGTAGTEDFVIDTAVFSSGGTVNLLSCTIVMPASA